MYLAHITCLDSYVDICPSITCSFSNKICNSLYIKCIHLDFAFIRNANNTLYYYVSLRKLFKQPSHESPYVTQFAQQRTTVLKVLYCYSVFLIVPTERTLFFPIVMKVWCAGGGSIGFTHCLSIRLATQSFWYASKPQLCVM